MKNNGLSLQQLVDWKKSIDNGSSIGIFEDPTTGKMYGAKSVTESAAGYFTELKNGNVFDASYQPVEGVRTIKGTAIGAGINQLVYAIRVLTDTSITTQDEASLIAAAWKDTAPVQMKNGRFSMFSGGELVRITGTDIHNFKASTGNDADFKDIVPFQLRGDVNFQATFNLAGTPAVKHAYKLEWRAIEFTEISKV